MISVIIMTYNGEKYIRKCMDSLIHQTIGIENLEIVVIDDVSTDATLQILEEYEKKYPKNICLIKRKVSQGVTRESNRNVGVNQASGDYILFLDQDDWYERDALEVLTGCLKEHPDLDYIEYSYHNADESGIRYETKRVKDKGFHVYSITAEAERNSLAIEGILPGATYAWDKIYKKEFLLKNNIHHNDGERKTGFSDNFFSGLLVMHCGKIGKLDVPLYNYTNRFGSFSHDARLNSKVQIQRCQTGIIFYEECRDRGFLKKNPEMVEYIFIRTFLLKTFWKFLLQYDPLPIDILNYLKKETIERFPFYRKNTIMAGRKELQFLFSVLDQDWSRGFLYALKEKTEKMLKEGEIRKYLYLN